MTKRKTRAPHHDLTPEKRTNELFEKFYKSLNLVDENEWESFIGSLRSDLPATFRLTSFGEHSKSLHEFLQNNYFKKICKSIESNEELKSITLKNLDWYPDNLAWQLDASKIVIRKNESFKDLFKFLISETDSGFISRQEAVSMIPPLLLDVKHNHFVLDLCAAPGSKSAQLVEMIHQDFEKNNLIGTPEGVVIANDLELTRSYIMVHQLKRLHSPCFIVTKEDAAIYPRLLINENEPIAYDRILADVPCSGDGTMRKNPQIWLNWKPNQGINEHVIQHRILKRGLELLREDGKGRLVYSTCSLNPVEDEAVVASMLEQCEGTVELVEPPSWIVKERLGKDTEKGTFLTRPGLISWHLINRDGTLAHKMEDIPEKNRSSYRKTMFPPPNIGTFNMDRSRRILPCDQNTGGFFVAILTKTKALPWMKQKKLEGEEKQTPSEKADKNGSEEAAAPPPKKALKINNYCKYNENPFIYIKPESDEDWKKISDYYKLDKNFPSDLVLYRPSVEPQKKRNHLYFTNATLKKIIQANQFRNLHIVNSGVGVFSFCDDRQFNGYRITQEGVNIMTPYFSKDVDCGRVIRIKGDDVNCLKDLLAFLNEETPLIDNFSQAVKDQWEKISIGPIIVHYSPGTNKSGYPKVTFNITGWRGIRSMRHYLKVFERAHYLRLCGVTDIPEIIKNIIPKAPEEKIARLDTDSEMKAEKNGE